MSSSNFSKNLIAAAASISLVASPAVAATPSDLADLVGVKGAAGESQLEARGYGLHHAAQGDDKSYTYWWNASSKKCVRVTTEDGRYTAINSESAGDCGKKSGDAGAAVAIGAAALIGALALSHKSHNHNDNNHYGNAQYEADYERGYNDGLYNYPYHNYSRSDYYSQGFEAGVRQRNYNGSYRDPYYGGGYGSYVNVNDLVGRSSSDARAQLSSRGFSLIETDDRYDGKYRTYWRASSEQCIVLHTRDSYVRSIDSVRKRNCR
ncbi:MAG: hypothetical protein ACK4SJ_02300 [Sphingorhabdus sp.]